MVTKNGTFLPPRLKSSMLDRPQSCPVLCGSTISANEFYMKVSKRVRFGVSRSPKEAAKAVWQ